MSSGMLLKALTEIKPVINKNTVLPILEDVLCEVTRKGANNSLIRITGTDLENSITIECECESSESFKFLLPHKLVMKFVSIIDLQPIVITYDHKNFSIEISCETVQTKVTSENHEDFPRIADINSKKNSTVILTDEIVSSIKKSINFCSGDELRPAMMGICFNFSEKELSIATTDAHKLYRFKTPISNTKIGKYIAPKLMGTQVVKSNQPNTIEFGDHDGSGTARLTIKNDTGTFVKIVRTRLIDANFPMIEDVIPTDNPNRITFDRNEGIKAFKTAFEFGNKTTHAATFELNGKVQLVARDLDFSNEVAIKIPSGKYKGAPMEIAFNSEFVGAVLKQIENDDITLSISTPTRAGLFENGNEIFLLMPIMVNM